MNRMVFQGPGSELIHDTNIGALKESRRDAFALTHAQLGALSEL